MSCQFDIYSEFARYNTILHKMRYRKKETTHRRNGLPATRTPERKTNKNINNNINNKSNNKTCRNKNSKINNNNNNNNYNNNNTHIGNSERSTRGNHNNSHSINSGKNTSNVTNKTNLANNNGITAVNIKNTNTSRKCNELDSTLNSTRSKANTNASSTARDGDGRGGAGEGAEGGGNDAGEEAWPCPTPCPTRCSSLDEESTFEFRQATINAAINTAMDRVKTVAQEGARAVLLKTIVQVKAEEIIGFSPNILYFAVPQRERYKEMEKKMEDIQEAVKPNAKEEIINKTVSQEIEVKERDSESIELKGKDGKTNIISGMMQDRLSRVAISLPDGAKSQFLKIRQWHVNKKGHLVLDCSLPLVGNGGAVKKEVRSRKTSIKHLANADVSHLESANVSTRRRESCWRRPCSVLRALATALRLHKPPICADCALRHGGVGTSDAFEDGSVSEDERQPAANTDAPRNTRNVTVYQTSQKRYEWDEKETEGSEDETRNKPWTGRSRSPTAPPRKSAILVDTGCDPRSAEAHSRTPPTPTPTPTPTPSPVEVAPCTCPDAAFGTGKTRDWLDDSAKNDASRDKARHA
ncbi:Protein of unknown function [Gryllus bimaculatus]|nr:Protein of unknown function [Gryllus bimaculatus]